MQPIRSIQDVVERQLCTGCGACAYLEPDRFVMRDAPAFGCRPFLRQDAVAESGLGLLACPGIALSHDFDESDPTLLGELRQGWGPVRAVWEAVASDAAIRRAGSSGGAASALALYCLEQGGADGVLHIAARPEAPHLNETVISRTRDQLLAATGSRYAPASPCDGLGEIETRLHRTVFIGKPCDVAAVRKAQRLRPELGRRLGPTIAFFCAGAPSTQGTVELLRRLGLDDLGAVRRIRYRGNGWPGRFTVVASMADGREETVSMSYEESWGFLQRYRQWRCYICPDHTGEFADVAVGDPWYRPAEPDEPGKSLIVARTARGHDLVVAAAATGYLDLERCDATLLPRSQPNLLKGRGALWGRMLALRCLGAAVPTFKGFETFAFWLRELGVVEKLRSLSGTAKRVFTRGLRRRVRVSADVEQSP